MSSAASRRAAQQFAAFLPSASVPSFASSLSSARVGRRSVLHCVPHRLAATTTASMVSLVGSNPVFAQCMLRITSPSASRKFYHDKLGMKPLTRFDFPDLKFSLFFYAFTDDVPPPQTDVQYDRAMWLWSRPYPTMELTWNWPADTFEEALKKADEGDMGDEVYVDGNQEPKGFGHVGIIVDDVQSAAEELGKAGFTAVQSGDEKGVGISVRDPDGYHVRLLERGGEGKGVGDGDAVFGNVMLRVKDLAKAVGFFERLGLSVVSRVENKEAQRSEVFMGYCTEGKEGGEEEKWKWLMGRRECMMRLVQPWEEGGEFVNGNVKPYRGFGHVGILVEDLHGTMKQLEEAGDKIIRKAGEFRDVGEIAFVAEPSTDYWVEVIQRQGNGPETPYAQP